MNQDSLTDLFFKNPCPMWVFDAETNQFLEVNESACEKYGYTREEFLQMTTLDIRPKSEQLKYHHAMKYERGMKSTGKTFIHVDKSGHEFMVKPLSFEMMYQGKNALAIQIIDVEDYDTERLRNKLLAAKLQKEIDELKESQKENDQVLAEIVSEMKADVETLQKATVSASNEQLQNLKANVEKLEVFQGR